MTNISSFDECVVEFDKLLPTFDDKVNFIKNCRDNQQFIDNEKFSPIKSAINFLVANASETETRKNQQQVLMPIVMKISQDLNDDEIIHYFQQNNYQFSLFCITYVTFLTEESVNKHIDTYHKHIVECLKKTVEQLTRNK